MSSKKQAFETYVHTRWGDQDALGHVNNVQFLRLFEEARVRFLDALGYIGSMDFGMVTVRHEVDYRKQLHFTLEPVRVECWLTRLGTASFTLHCRMFDAERDIVSDCSTVIVVTKLTGTESRAIPPEARAVLEPFLLG
ncbi:MAG: acyl-CoA thioesterase [Actinomycetia bacterium]|nr:acyl-CoA thioesterase [Actinomycetes bacterium]